jgi:hypothetical protein
LQLLWVEELEGDVVAIGMSIDYTQSEEMRVVEVEEVLQAYWELCVLVLDVSYDAH